MIVAYKTPDKEKQWRLLVAEALRKRGREDLSVVVAEPYRESGG